MCEYDFPFPYQKSLFKDVQQRIEYFNIKVNNET